MKELLMSKPTGGGGESSIIRADITVGTYTNEETTPPAHGYGYSNLGTIVNAPNFGQCSNSKITALYSGESSGTGTGTMLFLTTPMVASNVTITRLDTGYSISYPDAETKSWVIIDGSLLFTQQDVDKTIPIEIRFA